MSSYPQFNVPSFSTNTNQPPFNLNCNINSPTPIQPFQQNNMHYLSYPPPNLPGSNHVFQNVSPFPGTNTAILPAASIPGNSGMLSSAAFTTNITPASTNLMPSAAYAASVPGSTNLISPVAFTSLAALTSMPPPPITPMWNPTSFNPTQQPQNHSNNFQEFGSSNFREPIYNIRNPSTLANLGNFQKTQEISPGFRPPGLNPWSPISSNNFQNVGQRGDFRSSPLTAAAISPWASQSPGSVSSFQIGASPVPSNLRDSASPWASNSNSKNVSSNLHYNSGQIKKSPSKFRESKSPGFNINPWAQSPSLPTGGRNFQFSEGHGRKDQHNFKSNKFNTSNFNNRRGNSRNSFNNFQNENYHGQERKFQPKGDFRQNSNNANLTSCDTCDRSFRSEAELKSHVSEHTKCNFNNCQFEAHPKIIALHRRMQHDTGYAEVINNLKNAGEIEKWRAERRRRFPTAANILKRKAEQAEKEARGEVIETKEFGKFKKPKTEHYEKRSKRFPDRKKRRSNNINRFLAPGAALTISDSDSDDDSHIKLRKFAGTLAVTDTDASEPVGNSVSESEGPPIQVSDLPDKPEEQIESINPDDSQHSNAGVQGKSEVEETFKSGIKTAECTESRTSPVNIDSDDEAPIHIPIDKVPSSNETKTSADYSDEEAVQYVGERSLPHIVDLDSDDEAPLELPISKIPPNNDSQLANHEYKEAVKVPEKRTSCDPITIDSDDAPIQVSINKVTSSNIINTSANHGDERDSDDSPTEISVAKVPLTEISNSTSIAVKNLSSAPLDAEKVDKEAKSDKNLSKSQSHKEQRVFVSSHRYDHNHFRSSSLLEKLLADDIRHERNVIMQCIRHIVKKKYFGIGSDL